MIKNKMGALAGCAVLASGPRRVRQLKLQLEQLRHDRLERQLGDDLRGRLDVRRPGLRTVGLLAVAA